MVSLLSLPTSAHIHEFLCCHHFLNVYYAALTIMQMVCRYLPKIFNRFTSAEGFLFLQDNTVLNYWNLLQADKAKLWITNKVVQIPDYKTLNFKPTPTDHSCTLSCRCLSLGLHPQSTVKTWNGCRNKQIW